MKVKNYLILTLALLAMTATLIGCAPTPPAQQSPPAEPVATAPAQAPNADNSAVIGEEKAKSIALADAGIQEADVTFVRSYLNIDDGRQQYDVEFYGGNVEYDYEIDAFTGVILSSDRDAEYYAPNQATAGSVSAPPAQVPTSSGADIGEAKAKQIALSHAGYTESKVQLLRVGRDYDNGRLEYEVEFYVNYIEYNYEIDAANGNILNYEAERD